MSPVAQAALLVAFPVAAGATGASLAVLRRPSAMVVSGIQRFTAGVVVAAVAVELLPDLRHQGNLGWAAAGFATGVALVLSLAAYGRRVDAAIDARDAGTVVVPLGLLVTVGIDLLVDGLLIGLGVQLGGSEAMILTIALTLEVLFLVLAAAIELKERGIASGKAIAICTMLSLATLVGAVGSAWLLGDASPVVLAFVLAFGAAALFYLAIEELIVEAHELTETTALSAMFFAGFLVIYVLGELGS